MRQTWEVSSVKMIIETAFLLLPLLTISVTAKSGTDFPAFPNIPKTGFSCKNVPPGYYADLETDCQVFHICETSRKISFLCPNGTIFSQLHLICDWWFKVDCASAPTVYGSSVEYQTNEQEEIPKKARNLPKNYDIQQLKGTTNILMTELRKASFNFPNANKRLLLYKQLLEQRTTAKNLPLFSDTTLNPIQKFTAAETNRKQRKNFVKPNQNKFQNNTATHTNLSTYTNARVHKGSLAATNNITETQIAAETTSRFSNNNRQFLPDNNFNIFYPYTPYTPDPTVQTSNEKDNSRHNQRSLVPYTQHYTTVVNERAPYKRPGVSLLKNFIEKEKNKTLPVIAEQINAFESKHNLENIILETTDTFKLTTRIPPTTRLKNTYATETELSDKLNVYSSLNPSSKITVKPSYLDRREKPNLDTYSTTETSLPTVSKNKYYKDLSYKPGVIVPLSRTPETLPDLAIYYATELDSLSTVEPVETEATTPVFENIGNSLLTLLSIYTTNNYNNLFGDGIDSSKLLEVMKFEPKGVNNELLEDLNVQQTQNSLAGVQQIRELARIFTYAFSTYLQNPEHFKKVLADVRPTHPSVNDMPTHVTEPTNMNLITAISKEDDEILSFSEARFSLGLETDNTTITEDSTTTPTLTKTDISSAPFLSTMPWSTVKCCGRISASYVTKFHSPTTQTLPDNLPTVDTIIVNNSYISTTESSYIRQCEEFQINKDLCNKLPKDKKVNLPDSKLPNESAYENNLYSALTINATDLKPFIINANSKVLKNKKLLTTTESPSIRYEYFTDSTELVNDEGTKTTYSKVYFTPSTTKRSFLPQSQFNFDKIKKIANNNNKGHSENVRIVTPTYFSYLTVDTTTQPSTTLKKKDSESFSTTNPSIDSSTFYSPNRDRKTNILWPNTFKKWLLIDPIPLNYNLSTTEFEIVTQKLERQTNNSRIINKTKLTAPYTKLTDRSIEKTTDGTESLNFTTTRQLMDIMKKTKSNTIKRFILLLIQTCDNEYNITAEASQKALLQALTAISQNDTNEMAKEKNTANIINRKDLIEQKNKAIEIQESMLRELKKTEKEVNFNSMINKQSSYPYTSGSTEANKVLTEITQIPVTTVFNRRTARTSKAQTSIDPTTDHLQVAAKLRVAPQGSGLNTATDTRALELLRSLYTIAARWG